MNSFELLSEPIKRYIRDKRWEQLRPIQNAAIERITKTSDNYVLISRTASGKTEAAFLPILSKVNFRENGVQVLYISPLIALINDQFYRVEELCKYLDVTVTKWHGEASRASKDKILKEPTGIVLITPESLEAMFVNKPYNVKHLFQNLKYVVIDEIHSFVGTDRGTQLKSILSRIKQLSNNSFSVVGLSATMSEVNLFQEVKDFINNGQATKVLIDRSLKEIETKFQYFKNENQGGEFPLELLKHLYLSTKDYKVLIFPNSRGRTEEISVKLLKISDKVNGHRNYFSHHSSVDKEVREYIEHFAKGSTHQNFCITCTSTLELGIDIGAVDKIVQIDATDSIASLIQRIGRSGRRDGKTSTMLLYATDPWSLLQSLACWRLYLEGFIEPPSVITKPYDILLHQLLSIVKGSSGIQIDDLLNQLKWNYAFEAMDLIDINAIIEHSIKIGLLEKLQKELIVGVDGEFVVNSRDFYSIFKSEENFKITNAGNTIGQVPYSPQIIEGENLMLAAKIWKIIYVDFHSKKVEVIKANDGKRPLFFGGSRVVHPRIKHKMYEILFSSEKFEELDQQSSLVIDELKSDFTPFKIVDINTCRPLLEKDNELILYTFTGTKINRTIRLLLNIAGLEVELDDSQSAFSINASKQEFHSKWKQLLLPLNNLDEILKTQILKVPAIIDFSKWGHYLPIEFQINLLKEVYYDFESTKKFLNSWTLIYNKD